MTHISTKMNIYQTYYVFHCQHNSRFYMAVQSCTDRDKDQDLILLQQWKKEYVRTSNQCNAPVLYSVPVECFGEHVLVVEDDPAVREAINQKMLNRV